MDYIYNRDVGVNHIRSSYCFASCFTSLVLNNDLSCCRHCSHKEWTGNDYERFESPTYQNTGDRKAEFRLKMKNRKVFVSPIHPDDLQDCLGSYKVFSC